MSTSVAEQDFCSESIQQGVRLDGRGVADFRPVEVQLGLIAQANGSARLHVGGTDVLVGVKVETGVPSASRPDEGRVSVTVECSACASPEYEGRGGEAWGTSLAAALETSLCPLASVAGYGVDLRALSIVSGKQCWNIYVDALVLNDDGNVLCALSLASLAALANTRIPGVEIVQGEDNDEPEIELDDDMDNATTLELGGVPVIVSVSQVGAASVLDLSLAEEACARAALHVAVDASGRVCGVTKGGAKGVDAQAALAMIEAAQACGPKLIAGVHKYITVAAEAAARAEA
ncbi:hypothetical protein FOA52_001860 [Chlamydomonas sp. UWO 241]|nr:hypothetical protein FOA52_001860 [Chlamydomonas sp. UWO 241]